MDTQFSKLPLQKSLISLLLKLKRKQRNRGKKDGRSFQNPIKIERDALVKIINDRSCRCTEKAKEDSVDSYTEDLKKVPAPIRKDNFVTARKILRNVCGSCLKSDNLNEELQGWLKRNYEDARRSYDSFLYNETPTSVLKVKPVASGIFCRFPGSSRASDFKGQLR